MLTRRDPRHWGAFYPLTREPKPVASLGKYFYVRRKNCVAACDPIMIIIEDPDDLPRLFDRLGGLRRSYLHVSSPAAPAGPQKSLRQSSLLSFSLPARKPPSKSASKRQASIISEPADAAS